MIGRHVVTITNSPTGDLWGAPLNTNPGFSSGADGWALMGRAVYSGGGISLPEGQPVNGWYGGVAPSPGVQYGPVVSTQQIRVVARVRCDVATSIRLDIMQSASPDPNTGSQKPLGDFALLPGTRTIDITGTGFLAGAQFVYTSPRLYKITSNGSLWVDSLEMFVWDPANAPVDITCLVDEATIRHGRDDTTSQPDASTCTLDMSWINGVDTLPDFVEIGRGLFVDTEYPPGSGTMFRRFAGRITDLAYGWDEAGEETPDRVVGQIIGAGYIADLARRVVGDAPFPQELDGARVSRVLSLAGVALDPATSDPGTVQILPRDIDSQPALDVAHSTALSAGGMVWETRSGDVRYSDAEHRRGSLVALVLDACDILVTPTWSRTTDGLINSASIGYGAIPEGGEQPRWVVRRDDSIDRYGRYEFTATTELAALADAQSMASLILTRQSSPVWLFSQLPVDMAGLDDERTAALLGLDMHALVSVTGLPVAGGAPTTAALWVEGWQETLYAGGHDIQIAVSGFCRTAPPPRWDDIDPEWTWDTIAPASLTWDDITCMGPPLHTGRWADVPASLRWNAVDPGITWDTWEDS